MKSKIKSENEDFGKPQQLRIQLSMQCTKEALEISSSSAVKNIMVGGEQRDGLSSRKSVWKGYSKAQSRLGKTGLDQD